MSATAKHTPGPWAVHAEGLYNGPGFRSFTIRRDDLNSLGGTLPLGDKAADVRLIAAAPELLEALKSIMPLAESRVDVIMADDRRPDERSPHERDLLEVLRAANAAIAKAEGGAA